MKDIIGGRLYDTETATELFSREAVYDHNEDTRCKESLYLSPNKRFFIACDFDGHIRVVNDGSTDFEWWSGSAREWLEHGNAPQSVYEAAGLAIEEG